MEKFLEYRSPTKNEYSAISKLINIANNDGKNLPLLKITDFKVAQLLDGKMGSLRILQNNSVDSKRKFNNCCSDSEFLDQDGVLVKISLYLDNKGELFELDIWKVDFSPLKSFEKFLT